MAMRSVPDHRATSARVGCSCPTTPHAARGWASAILLAMRCAIPFLRRRNPFRHDLGRARGRGDVGAVHTQTRAVGGITDDVTKPDQWVFPNVTIGAKSYLVVFASGRDVRTPGASRLHTNFKMSLTGEYLGLFSADAPRRACSRRTTRAPRSPSARSTSRTSSSSTTPISRPRSSSSTR